jgi:IPT/TIG domain/Lipocalin-like domain
MKNFLFTLCAIVVLSGIFTSCKKEKDDPQPAVPAPIVTGISPTSGMIGTTVTISGTNLTGTAVVSFNGTAATTFSVVSATSVTATVPAGATTGNVTVTTASGTSNGIGFTVLTLTQLLTDKNWRLTAYTSDNGSRVTDVYATLDACEKDDLLRFELPNIFTYDQGATRCSASDPQTQTGTWAFNANQTKLTTTLGGLTDTSDITELTANTLKIRYVDNFGGTNYIYVLTYTKQ